MERGWSPISETSVPASNQLDYKDATVQDLDKLLSMARGARSRFEPTWHLNYAYYFGEQLSGYSGTEAGSTGRGLTRTV